ncbi:uncharacterized protein LOC132407666 isoform X3 [Hypanus sabinus]|uniref:uncharacterized protein LOC132407666 isoform X3 n=1 Tax=Hypanus sabinus TaxID=79690 RepID=UPI0028C4BE24|nr:uncharacterized protein LOC132407666 isoform X3 [Hypanus sabinus]
MKRRATSAPGNACTFQHLRREAPLATSAPSNFGIVQPLVPGGDSLSKTDSPPPPTHPPQLLPFSCAQTGVAIGPRNPHLRRCGIAWTSRARVPAPLSHSMPPLSNATHSQHPRMEPGVLIFLLYVMIIHELVCGWIEYKRQAAKPKKPARPVWCPHLLSFARSLVLSFVWLLFCLEFIENACKEMTLRYSSRTHSGSKEFFLRMYVKCGSPVHSRPPIHSTKQEKLRDWKKSGRIVRKA